MGIARDTRASGPSIEGDLTAGATAAGAEAQSAGVITTPGIAYLTRALPADAGVVISASHNPYHDNGIKVFVSSGCNLDEAMELAIERDLKNPPAHAPNFAQSSAAAYVSLESKYLSFLRDELGAGLNLSHLTLVVDCANGASYELAPELFKSLGANVHTINAEPDGRNINFDCGSLHPERLQAAVHKHKADLGL